MVLSVIEGPRRHHCCLGMVIEVDFGTASFGGSRAFFICLAWLKLEQRGPLLSSNSSESCYTYPRVKATNSGVASPFAPALSVPSKTGVSALLTIARGPLFAAPFYRDVVLFAQALVLGSTPREHAPETLRWR
jgi:hypothetical protein